MKLLVLPPTTARSTELHIGFIMDGGASHDPSWIHEANSSIYLRHLHNWDHEHGQVLAIGDLDVAQRQSSLGHLIARRLDLQTRSGAWQSELLALEAFANLDIPGRLQEDLDGILVF